MKWPGTVCDYKWIQGRCKAKLYPRTCFIWWPIVAEWCMYIHNSSPGSSIWSLRSSNVGLYTYIISTKFSNIRHELLILSWRCKFVWFTYEIFSWYVCKLIDSEVFNLITLPRYYYLYTRYPRYLPTYLSTYSAKLAILSSCHLISTWWYLLTIPSFWPL